MKKLAISLILFFIVNESQELPVNTKQKEKIIKDFKSKQEEQAYLYHFNKTIQFIKEHEGFRSYPYTDINGHKTIGYGFIVDYLPLKYRSYITKEQAHNVIINKMKKNIKFAQNWYPNLNEFQVLAVAHLAYGKGFGRIQNHPLHKQLKKEEFIKYNDWVYFSSYERTRDNYRKSREYEYKLFNYELN